MAKVKEYKVEKAWGDWEIDQKVRAEGTFGWKPILMTAVVIKEDGFDPDTKEKTFRQINYFIFFEKDKQ